MPMLGLFLINADFSCISGNDSQKAFRYTGVSQIAALDLWFNKLTYSLLSIQHSHQQAFVFVGQNNKVIIHFNNRLNYDLNIIFIFHQCVGLLPVCQCG